jgi:prepilin peptidase CpaA
MQGHDILPTVWTSLWFLPFVMAIGVWVSWSDMKFMKIPNTAVIALALVYLVIGPVALPLQDWLWGWAIGAIVLVIGFLASTARLIGAGDAKFGAAMAPFFVTSDIRVVLAMLSACLLAAFAAHRAMRALPAMRRAAPDWKSWTSRDFPMGLALSGLLIFHFVAALLIAA